jgi:hypothetical protein
MGESRKMTASEAIYGFCAWLTTRNEVTTMSAKHNAGSTCDLIATFCKENKLPEPRDNWTENLIHPSGECSGPANQN